MLFRELLAAPPTTLTSSHRARRPCCSGSCSRHRSFSPRHTEPLSSQRSPLLSETVSLGAGAQGEEKVPSEKEFQEDKKKKKVVRLTRDNQEALCVQARPDHTGVGQWEIHTSQVSELGVARADPETQGCGCSGPLHGLNCPGPSHCLPSRALA